MFDTILVANRGEIALRVMRTARALGLRCVAVHSDADAHAPHVAFADDAVNIGPAPVGESYLRGDAIIEAARLTGAQAIHPGYGFLSENAAFVREVEAAGLVFVGPPAEAVEVMGDKARAKRRMEAAGVPCVPGYQGEDQSDATLLAEADKIGAPIMVKAAAGGGGRGMRLVDDLAALPEAIRRARAEAISAFGSGDLILEKAILRPRHVEIQVFADAHGTTIHLGERDCSVQRRHQKVIEEAPSPAVDPDLRARMGAAAVAAAEAVGYRGAGTVEFLLDAEGRFYFLEMNTRLQVEHPVTEAITGLDLVALQIAVAQGRPLGLAQEDVRLDGHAIEVRLYAEDPANGFLPATGPMALWRAPEGVRTDAGVGAEVSPHYDPMLAKIVAHGPDRDAARRRLIAALERTALLGPATNRGFLIDALKAETFAKGGATTAFLAETFPEIDSEPATDAEAAIAAVLTFRRMRAATMAAAVSDNAKLANWSSAGAPTSVIELSCAGEARALTLRPRGETYTVAGGAALVEVTVEALGPNDATLRVDGRRVSLAHAMQGADLLLALPGRDLRFHAIDRAAEDAAGGDGAVRAPMHGKVIEVLAAEGDTVEAGQRLAVLEAMKMQHEILAPVGGTISIAAARADAQVAADDLLFEIQVADG